MRGRLFWKILLGFWLTFIIMTQALWVTFTFYGNRHEVPENSMTWRIANLQLTSAASVLRSSGMPALNAMVAKWPETERRFLSVTPASKPSADQPGSDRPAKLMVEWVTGADNQSYLLSYDLEGLRADIGHPSAGAC